MSHFTALVAVAGHPHLLVIGVTPTTVIRRIATSTTSFSPVMNNEQSIFAVDGGLRSYQHIPQHGARGGRHAVSYELLPNVLLISFPYIRTDSSFSDGEGPAADLVQPGRLYTYSSDEEEKSRKHVPVKQKIRPSRFVSRIQHERAHIQSEKLDMETFQPMMTSETVRESKKRESESEDWVEEPSRYLRKRERKESDYGSLSSLGSDMVKLDIMEQESNYPEPDRSSKLLSECMTFRRTMTQLRKQTMTLVKVMLPLLLLKF